MATLHFNRAHSGDVQDAAKRIKAVIEDFSSRYSSHLDSVDWQADGLGATASGKRFKASFVVGSDQVNITVELLGMMARVLKGKVESKVTETLDEQFPVA